jgi:hypothetical protein
LGAVFWRWRRPSFDQLGTVHIFTLFSCPNY